MRIMQKINKRCQFKRNVKIVKASMYGYVCVCECALWGQRKVALFVSHSWCIKYIQNQICDLYSLFKKLSAPAARC